MLKVDQLKVPDTGSISFDLDPGQCLGISGDSGVGKTRLLRAIADMDDIAGNIMLDGVNRFELSGHEWRQNVCLVPAESEWWWDSVGEHLVDSEPETVLSMLHNMGFGEEVLAWEIARCSSGEKQRLSIARTLIQQPKVLLLDEPTANLDSKNTQKIEALLKSYLEENKAAALCVSHDRAQLNRVSTKGSYCMTREGLELCSS